MGAEEEKHQKHEKILQRISGFRLMDDEMMTMVFDGNVEGIQLVLNIILERTDLTVTDVKTQDVFKNVNGHSVRFDVHAKDSAGIQYEVEIQRADQGAGAQRARFNGSMLDTRMLKPGNDYSELPDAYVIFITEKDVLGASLPLYHINRWIEETRQPFRDGSHIIYANGAYQDEDSEIGKLMHDFRCPDPADMHYRILAERVRYFKETEGGQEAMSRAMEELCNEAAAEAEHDRSVSVALSLLEDGMSCEKVAKHTKLSLEEVEALAAQKSA